MRFIAILLMMSVCFCSSVFSQGLYEIKIDEKVSNASLIIEGEVVDQHSFWNSAHTMIYTSNKIAVYKIFKGEWQPEFIEVVTTGGTVDNTYIYASELLILDKGNTGIFFLYDNGFGLRSPATNQKLLDVYSSAQGFISYNLRNQTAADPFSTFKTINTELYSTLTAQTGIPLKNKKPSYDVRSFSKEATAGSRVMATPVIASFTPASANAGMLLDPVTNVLTIRGTGFGAPGGTAAVLFDDANNGTGGTTFDVASNSPLILSWTDTEIRVQVPSRAGTGIFSVRESGGQVGNSPGVLEIITSILTFSFSSGTVIKEANLMNANGAGGYTVVYSTNTAGGGVNLDASPAKATFQRALTTWREISGWNVIEGGTTTSQAVNPGDGLNTIMYDNTNTGNAPLATGVLATCYSSGSICLPTNTNQAQLLGFDVVIRNAGVSTGSTSFTEGPCPPNSTNYTQIDLESVLYHELGHAIGLGHINDPYQGGSVGRINPSKVMHYAVINSTKRVSPDYSAKFGAAYTIAPQGNVYGGPCGLYNAEMTPLATIVESKDECPVIFPVVTTAAGTTVNFDMVHATSNRFTDPNYLQVRVDGYGASLSNNAYYAIRSSSTGGQLNINVSNYNTVPASLTSCPQTYSGIPPGGFRLALYQVNACPLADAFPARVAYREFAANGALSPITGLSANTNYLVFVEGIENTKATFSLQFGGTLLPIKLGDFTGVAEKEYNQLNWTIVSMENVKTVTLEKSADGYTFEPLHVMNASEIVINTDIKYLDRRPYAGNNYYRLSTKDIDGSISYSKTVRLKRSDSFTATIFPNPSIDGRVTIEISALPAQQLELSLYSSTGHLLHAQTEVMGASHQLVQLSSKKLPAGVYFIKINNKTRGDNKALKIVVE